LRIFFIIFISQSVGSFSTLFHFSGAFMSVDSLESLVSHHVFNIFANLLGIFRALLLPLDFYFCSFSMYVFFFTFFYYYYYYLRDFARHTENGYANKRKVQETKQGSWPGRKEGRKMAAAQQMLLLPLILGFQKRNTDNKHTHTRTHTVILANCKRQI